MLQWSYFASFHFYLGEHCCFFRQYICWTIKPSWFSSVNIPAHALSLTWERERSKTCVTLYSGVLLNFNIERVHRSLNDRHYVSNNNCAVVLVSVVKQLLLLLLYFLRLSKIVICSSNTRILEMFLSTLQKNKPLLFFHKNMISSVVFFLFTCMFRCFFGCWFW